MNWFALRLKRGFTRVWQFIAPSGLLGRIVYVLATAALAAASLVALSSVNTVQSRDLMMADLARSISEASWDLTRHATLATQSGASTTEHEIAARQALNRLRTPFSQWPDGSLSARWNRLNELTLQVLAPMSSPANVNREVALAALMEETYALGRLSEAIRAGAKSSVGLESQRAAAFLKVGLAIVLLCLTGLVAIRVAFTIMHRGTFRKVVNARISITQRTDPSAQSATIVH